MIHRQLSFIILLVMVVTYLLSVPQWYSSGLATRPGVLAQHPESTPAVTTIRWLMPWDEAQVQQLAKPLLAAFEKQYPAIDVQLQTFAGRGAYDRALAIALNAGTAPDVFYVSTVKAYALALQEQILPLGDWVATDRLDITAFAPDVLAQYRRAAQGLHCLPSDIATLVLFYDKARFDAAGVPYPQAPWTWDDLLTTAQQLTQPASAAEPYYGIDRFDAYWPLAVWTATGHNSFDDPYTPTQFLLTDKAAIDALQWLADLSLVHGVMPPPADEEADTPVVDRFLTGQAAMQIGGLWQLPAYLAQPDLHVALIALPGGAFTANRSDGNCFAIARNTPHAEAAWTFVKFLAGSGSAGAALLAEHQPLVPALNDAQTALPWLSSALPGSNIGAFLPEPAIRFALADPLHPIYSRWAAVLDEELPKLWRGEETAAAVVTDMAEEAEELLDNLQPAIESGQSAAPTITMPLTAATVVTATGAAYTQAPVTTTLALTLPFAQLQHYYVAPQGDDDNDGESPMTAFATLQYALDRVQPGDTIHLLSGDYFENVVSRVDGRVDAPITVMGPVDAVLHGAGAASAAFYLTHSYYTLTGFTIDGLYGDPAQKEGYTQKLLYVQGEGRKQGVTGLHVLNMRFQNAGGECLRLRYFAQKNEIAYSTFTTCGLLDFAFAEGGKNGEAIYIGTSSTQWGDEKNPTADPDESNENWVHHNVIDTQGNECVEIKEGASANLIEYNTCTGQLDPDSGGIGARGDRNIIRYNVVDGTIGAGVRLGGHAVEGVQYGVQNEVYGNRLRHNVAGGINIAVGPQARICGNWLSRNLGKASLGDAGEDYQPSEPCS